MTISDKKTLGSLAVSGFGIHLFKWKGSLYKLCYKELIIFLIPFGIISAVYRHVLDQQQKKLFEQLVSYFHDYLDMIPLSFILGFYVTIIATRWWQQYMALPSPDRLMLSICLYLPGTDIESRQLRIKMLRYCHLMLILILRSISDSVKSRLTTLEDLVTSGFMTRNEMNSLLSINSDVNLYWVPGVWFIHLLREAKKEGRIRDAQGLKLITEEFLQFRSYCRILWCYDWVSIPLVYTQVVTLATYSFFIACLFGRQCVGERTSHITVDIYFPLWTILQFLFYMGLLKVAEKMIDPYGHDDEDFDLNFLIDRHMKVINLGADTLWDSYPLIADDYVCKRISTESNICTTTKCTFSHPFNGRCFAGNEEADQLECKEETKVSSGQENPTLSEDKYVWKIKI